MLLVIIQKYKKTINGQKIQMDNNISQQMQNWKKMMIMDPLLNNLFDQTINIKDFIHQRILTLDHQQIVHIYSKLSSVKHAISKQVQKQVETKHDIIQQSFLSKHKISSQLKIENPTQIQKITKNIQNFNQNYINVKENITKLQNINKIIRFSKGLQKFKINCRLLKTFMKDYNSVNKEDQSSPVNNTSSKSLPSVSNLSNESLNLLKVSKLLKQLNELMNKHDFSGIKYFQTQKHFINSSKDILYSLTDKQLTKSLSKYQEMMIQEIKTDSFNQKANLQKIKSLQQDIKQKFKILNSINRLKQFIPTFCKKIFITTSDILKNLFQTCSIQNFKDSLMSNVFISLLSNAKLLIRLQQILTISMLSKNLISANLPNLFQKYIQRIVSYLTNLINWNLDQDQKQTQKRKSNSKIVNYELFGEIKQLSQNKNMKLKIPLIYKYPILYRGLSSLVNKIHEQVLLRGQYNRGQYEFYVKKSQIMNTLLPISKRFNHRFEELINLDISMDKQVQNRLRVDNIRWLYNKVMGIGYRQQQVKSGINNTISQQMDIDELGILIQSMNERLLSKLKQLIQQQIHIQNTLDVQYRQNQILLNRQRIRQLLKLIIIIIDRKQVLNYYINLSTVIQHLKLIKYIKSFINYQITKNTVQLNNRKTNNNELQ